MNAGAGSGAALEAFDRLRPTLVAHHSIHWSVTESGSINMVWAGQPAIETPFDSKPALTNCRAFHSALRGQNWDRQRSLSVLGACLAVLRCLRLSCAFS